MNLSLPVRETLAIINDESATNAIINLTIEDDNSNKKVMLKDFQVDPVKNKLLQTVYNVKNEETGKPFDNIVRTDHMRAARFRIL